MNEDTMEVTSVEADDDWDLNDPDTTETEEGPAAEAAEAEAEQAEAQEAEAEDKETEPEQEQTEEAAQDTNAEAETADQKPEERFELTFLGQKVSYGRDEVIQLAQKGMNYDHAVGAANEKIKEYEDFFHTLSPNEKVEDVMDGVLARIKAQREGIDEGLALQHIKLDRERRTLEKGRAEAARQQQAEEARKASFARFAKEHPDVDVKTIPQKIWAEVANGGDLNSLYAAYENRLLRQEIEDLKKKVSAAEQNEKNKSKSTGSASSAGKAPEKDAFDAAWDDE